MTHSRRRNTDILIGQLPKQTANLCEKHTVDRSTEAYRRECYEIFIRYIAEKENSPDEDIQCALNDGIMTVNGIHTQFKLNTENLFLWFSLDVGEVDPHRATAIYEHLLTDLAASKLPCSLLPGLDATTRRVVLCGCVKIPEHLMEMIESSVNLIKATSTAYTLRQTLMLTI